VTVQAAAPAKPMTTDGSATAMPAHAAPGAVLLRRLLLPLAVIAVLVVVWDALIRVFDIPAYVIPAPASVGQALVKERARLVDNAIPTIMESLGGFALGNLVAIATAIGFVHNKALERALYLDPDLVLAHFALGNVARRQEKVLEAARHFNNVRTLLSAYPPEQVLPEFDGMTAGRLIDILCSTAGVTALPKHDQRTTKTLTWMDKNFS